MTQQPHLTSVALKWKPVARGKRAPRASSIVDGFCRLPSLVSAADSVEPDVCHHVLAAAQASPLAMHGDVQNGSRRATTRDGLCRCGDCCAVAQVRRARAATPWRTVRLTRSMNAVLSRPEKPIPCKEALRAASVPRRIT